MIENMKKKRTRTMPRIVWLACLPLPIYNRVIELSNKNYRDETESMLLTEDTSFEMSLMTCFAWAQTEEGHMYWQRISESKEYV